MLCFGDIPKAQLLRVCGRKRCDAVACATCLDVWCACDCPQHCLRLASFTRTKQVLLGQTTSVLV